MAAEAAEVPEVEVPAPAEAPAVVPGAAPAPIAPPALPDVPPAVPANTSGALTALPPFPADGDVDKVTINASTDAFLNGLVELATSENDQGIKRQVQLFTVLAKVVTTNGRLISHDLTQLTKETAKLAEFLQQDVTAGQSCFEELRKAISGFATQFESLKEALLLISANSKTAAADEKDVRKKLLEETKGAREVMTHVRNNSSTIMRHCAHSLWELRELRTGGTQKDQADANGGSVLCGIESQVDNLETSTKEGFTKLGIDVVTAVEKGTDPEKSLIFKKRKEMAAQAPAATPMTPSPAAGIPVGSAPSTEPPSAKRVKFCHPITRVEYEGTVEERANAMRLWMDQMSSGSAGSAPAQAPAFEFPSGYGFPPPPFYPPPPPHMFGYGTPTGASPGGTPP